MRAGEARMPDPIDVSRLSELVARSGVPGQHHPPLPPGRDDPAPRRERRPTGSATTNATSKPCCSSGPRPPPTPPECRARVVAAAIEAFQTRSYSEVTVSDIAEAAQMAQGHRLPPLRLQGGSAHRGHRDPPGRHRVPLRSRPSTALGGPAGLTDDPEKTAMVFGHLVAGRAPHAAGARGPGRQRARAERRSGPPRAADPGGSGGPAFYRPGGRARDRHQGRACRSSSRRSPPCWSGRSGPTGRPTTGRGRSGRLARTAQLSALAPGILDTRRSERVHLVTTRSASYTPTGVTPPTVPGAHPAVPPGLPGPDADPGPSRAARTSGWRPGCSGGTPRSHLMAIYGFARLVD